jgi:hypothetical protein
LRTGCAWLSAIRHHHRIEAFARSKRRRQPNDATRRQIEERELEIAVVAGVRRELLVELDKGVRQGRPACHHESPGFDRSVF